MRYSHRCWDIKVRHLVDCMLRVGKRAVAVWSQDHCTAGVSGWSSLTGVLADKHDAGSHSTSTEPGHAICQGTITWYFALYWLQYRRRRNRFRVYYSVSSHRHCMDVRTWLESKLISVCLELCLTTCAIMSVIIVFLERFRITEIKIEKQQVQTWAVSFATVFYEDPLEL